MFPALAGLCRLSAAAFESKYSKSVICCRIFWILHRSGVNRDVICLSLSSFAFVSIVYIGTVGHYVTYLYGGEGGVREGGAVCSRVERQGTTRYSHCMYSCPRKVVHCSSVFFLVSRGNGHHQTLMENMKDVQVVGMSGRGNDSLTYGEVQLHVLQDNDYKDEIT